MLESAGIVESDQQILDRLFTLFDETGDGQINFREFVCGISVIMRGNIKDKLEFSFQLYDFDGNGCVTPQEMKDCLMSMNNTASYFGDTPVTKEEADSLVDAIFKESDANNDGVLDYKEYMHAVSNHPVLVAFIKQENAPAAEGKA